MDPQPQEPQPQEPKKTTLIMHPGYATGDQFAIMAKMIADKDCKVVLSTTGVPAKKGDCSAAILKLYEESGLGDRVRTLKVDGIYDRKGFERQAKELYNNKPDGADSTYACANLGTGTKFVAYEWKPGTGGAVRDQWKVEQDHDRVQSWLDQKGLKEGDLKDKKVAVLWSRFSGKSGGAHAEHDTSLTGMKDMVESMKGKFDAIIIVGDRHPAAKHQQGGYSSLVNDGVDGNAKVVDLTQFWKEDSQKLKAWDGDKRLGQLKLYAHLEKQCAGVVHIGARSGNLEALALMGCQVGYLEQKHSMGGPRMDAWQNAKDHVKYQKILLDQLPTRTGKYMAAAGVTKVVPMQNSVQQKLAQDNKEQVNRYAQHKLSEPRGLPLKERGAGNPKEPRIEKFQKGFNDTDLASITHFAEAAVLEKSIARLQVEIASLPTATLEQKQQKVEQLAKLESLQEARKDVLNAQKQTVDAQSAKLNQSVTQEEIQQARNKVNALKTELWEANKSIKALDHDIRDKQKMVKGGVGHKEQLEKDLEGLLAERGECCIARDEIQNRLESAKANVAQLDQKVHAQAGVVLPEKGVPGVKPRVRRGDLEWAKKTRGDEKGVLEASIAKLDQGIQNTQAQKQELEQAVEAMKQETLDWKQQKQWDDLRKRYQDQKLAKPGGNDWEQLKAKYKETKAEGRQLRHLPAGKANKV